MDCDRSGSSRRSAAGWRTTTYLVARRKRSSIVSSRPLTAIDATRYAASRIQRRFAMSTDFSDTATAVEQVAVGAAQSAAEVASDPIGAARKQVRSFERKGTPAVRRINRRINALMPDRVKVFGVEVNDKLPEKLAVKGLQLVKVQARREDVVGDVAKRTLRIFNGSFKTIARTATRLEQASELTTRQGAARPVSTRSRRRPARRRAA